MTGKGRELANMMKRSKVDVLCVQETRRKGSKARSMVAGFNLYDHGVEPKGGICKEYCRGETSVEQVNEGEAGNWRCDTECWGYEEEKFCCDLDEVVECTPREESVGFGADFYEHVGKREKG